MAQLLKRFNASMFKTSWFCSLFPDKTSEQEKKKKEKRKKIIQRKKGK